jgi:gamma-glutamyltranspeptidase / glutathione hydrolase
VTAIPSPEEPALNRSTQRIANTVINRRQAVKVIGAGLFGSALLDPLGLFGGRTVAQDRGAAAPVTADSLPVESTRAAVGRHWAAATVHPLATQAAMNAFARGGNAFDAAVAAAFMLGVVDGHNSGIGGGCFVLARTAGGEFVAIDGRETAPAMAHRDMYLRDGKPDPTASQLGPLASGVPGQVAALAKLSFNHGRNDWSAALLEAAQTASEGYEITASTASAIRRQARALKQFPASVSQFLRADGSPPSIGDRLRQRDLGSTLSALAEHGPDWFYRGPFAVACEKWMAENGGMLAAGDLKDYQAKSREPLRTTYRDWQILGFPPPSSGGIHIAQMLMMLEQFPVKSLLQDEPATAVHLLAEVMKRAFADRAHWLGDADHVDVPRGLIDRQYCHELAASIDLARTTEVLSHGQPPRANVDLFSRQHTTHLTTADAEGNWVAITNTVNTTFGSCVVIPGTGVVMNNQMDDFSISPGTPNAFGLIGAEANAIAPGKRPLSSMSPTIVTDAQGNPRVTCGAAGGPRIINAVLQTLVRVLELGVSVEEALAAPRLHHQWSPDQLLMEQQWEQAVVTAVGQRGHKLANPGSVAVAQAIERTATGELFAASDPRVDSAAAAG